MSTTGSTERVGRVFALGHPPAEHAERDAIVSVRLFVRPVRMDPSYQLLGGLAVVERSSYASHLLGQDCDVSEEFQTPMIRILRIQKLKRSVELNQRLPVRLGNCVGALEPVPECVELVARIGHTDNKNRTQLIY